MEQLKMPKAKISLKECGLDCYLTLRIRLMDSLEREMLRVILALESGFNEK